MCGIFCQLSASSSELECDKTVYEQLKKRGPNWSQNLTVQSLNSCYQCLLSAHVLHMRGVLTPQPIQDNNGNVLLWNGEVFGGLPVLPKDNDTSVLSQMLASCNSPSEILDVFSSIQGPWALIYYQKAGDYLWFGRDFFGRRSLLWKFDPEVKTLALSSVAAYSSESNVWEEVPAVGLYRINLKTITEAIIFEVYPWAKPENSPISCETKWETIHSECIAVTNHSGLVLPSPVSPLNISMPDSTEEQKPESNDHVSVKYLELLLASHKQNNEVNCLIDVLSEAVRRRVQSLPVFEEVESSSKDEASVAILFSGGIDSMILAALANRHIPTHQPIDLLNVAFKLQEPKTQKESAKKSKKHKNKTLDPNADNCNFKTTTSPFDVPDRITGKAGLEELRALSPERKWNFVEINVTQEELQEMRQDRICHLVYPLDTVLDDSIGCAVWFAARGTGLISEGSDQRLFSSTAKVSKLCVN